MGEDEGNSESLGKAKNLSPQLLEEKEESGLQCSGIPSQSTKVHGPEKHRGASELWKSPCQMTGRNEQKVTCYLPHHTGILSHRF
ncbi:hypothetical protein I79_008595 [Cricetulus griseus]|uniref:Uncharacterized protein n=1 Tax=Cricetulus griseus TaxID=10029 RepID=G3HDL2_CRIGR|nr:hypothetical protein I79_008595 [Cricetulus griseus]